MGPLAVNAMVMQNGDFNRAPRRRQNEDSNGNRHRMSKLKQKAEQRHGKGQQRATKQTEMKRVTIFFNHLV